jgi:hypothetical protein
MPIACKLCLAAHGLRREDFDRLPRTEEELFDHLERVHGYIVRRAGESAEEAEARVRRAQPAGALRPFEPSSPAGAPSSASRRGSSEEQSQQSQPSQPPQPPGDEPPGGAGASHKADG